MDDSFLHVDFVKLLTYSVFFMLILNDYGLPIHIIRDLYMTTKAFLQRLRDLVQYRRAMSSLNQRYVVWNSLNNY